MFPSRWFACNSFIVVWQWKRPNPCSEMTTCMCAILHSSPANISNKWSLSTFIIFLQCSSSVQRFFFAKSSKTMWPKCSQMVYILSVNAAYIVHGRSSLIQVAKGCLGTVFDGNFPCLLKAVTSMTQLHLCLVG